MVQIKASISKLLIVADLFIGGEASGQEIGFAGYAESVRKFQPRAAPWGFEQRFHLANAESVRTVLTNPFRVHSPLFRISVTQGAALGWN